MMENRTVVRLAESTNLALKLDGLMARKKEIQMMRDLQKVMLELSVVFSTVGSDDGIELVIERSCPILL